MSANATTKLTSAATSSKAGVDLNIVADSCMMPPESGLNSILDSLLQLKLVPSVSVFLKMALS